MNLLEEHHRHGKKRPKEDVSPIILSPCPNTDAGIAARNEAVLNQSLSRATLRWPN